MYVYEHLYPMQSMYVSVIAYGADWRRSAIHNVLLLFSQLT